MQCMQYTSYCGGNVHSAPIAASLFNKFSVSVSVSVSGGAWRLGENEKLINGRMLLMPLTFNTNSITRRLLK